MAKKKNDIPNYDASQIQVLDGLEAVRKRPGMYIGGTGPNALHHMVYEGFDNSVDEFVAGFCDEINITILNDNSIKIKDNGRGIPVDLHPKLNKPAIEVIFTVLHSGGKFGGDSYSNSGGLHGVGLSVVNALSEWVKVYIEKDGYEWFIQFQQDKVTKPLKRGKKTKKTGTTIHFKPDAEIFDTTIINLSTLLQRFKEVTYLNKGLKITVTDEREVPFLEKVMESKGGLNEFISELTKNKNLIHSKPIYITGEKNTKNTKGKEETVQFECVLQYSDSERENVFSFVNNIKTNDGGTHETGFKTALSRVINDVAKKKQFLKGENFLGDDLREGLISILNIKMPEPKFEGQTKGKLSNSEIRGVIEGLTTELLTNYFNDYPNTLKAIIKRAEEARKTREALKKVREVSKKKNSTEMLGLTSKLATCSSDKPEDCEIYFVEGDSAGGSAKQGRDKETQAVLPLKGKILNCEKSKITKILSSIEIQNIITTLGTGIGKDFDISKLKYHKIIIMTDADVDGSHIRILLLTFLYRYMKPLIENGHVYIAVPPLYLITVGKETYYTYSEKEKEKLLKKLKEDYPNSKIEIQRYKGLGEMDEDQLWETTMNPENRTIIQVTEDDCLFTDHLISLLMGPQSTDKKQFIEENSKYKKKN